MQHKTEEGGKWRLKKGKGSVGDHREDDIKKRTSLCFENNHMAGKKYSVKQRDRSQ